MRRAHSCANTHGCVCIQSGGGGGRGCGTRAVRVRDLVCSETDPIDDGYSSLPLSFLACKTRFLDEGPKCIPVLSLKIGEIFRQAKILFLHDSCCSGGSPDGLSESAHSELDDDGPRAPVLSLAADSMDRVDHETQLWRFLWADLREEF